ncbi:hypothetical protein ACFX19_034070 [Malus domestica]
MMIELRIDAEMQGGLISDSPRQAAKAKRDVDGFSMFCCSSIVEREDVDAPVPVGVLSTGVSYVILIIGSLRLKLIWDT